MSGAVRTAVNADAITPVLVTIVSVGLIVVEAIVYFSPS